MIGALIWGALAASSLILGAWLGLLRPWPNRGIGVVLAFGAGALISAVSFDLAQEGVRLGGGPAVVLGLAAGALTYFAADRFIERYYASRQHSSSSDAGPALALGAFLDGIPEQIVLGIGLAVNETVGIGLLAAIFVSNLPEAVGSATDMNEAGESRSTIMRLWIAVAVICVVATVVGFGIADNVSGGVQGAVNGFAAGALLVMLIDSMIPEATRKAGNVAGLAAVLGFAGAAALSFLD